MRQSSGTSVWIVAPDFDRVRGGIELHARLLAVALRKRGCLVKRLDPWAPNLTPEDTGGLFMVEGVSRYLSPRITRVMRRVRAAKVLFTHGSFYEFAHSKDLFRSSRPVNYLTMALKRFWDVAFMQSYLESFDRIFVLSYRELADLATLFPTVEGHIRISENFVVPPRSLPTVAPFQNLSNRLPLLVTVGRIDRRKNIRAALEAVSSVQVSYILAGKDGGELRTLQRFARRNRIHNFHYVGEVTESQKWQLLLASNAVVIPSFFEGVPFAALEPLAVSRPVICTEFSYLTPMAGVTTCDVTPTGIVKAIETTLKNPPSEYGPLPTEASVINAFLSETEGL